jgi:hypothetical protein
MSIMTTKQQHLHEYHHTFPSAYGRFLRAMRAKWSRDTTGSANEFDLTMIDPSSALWVFVVKPNIVENVVELRRHVSHVANVVYRIASGPLNVSIHKVLKSHMSTTDTTNSRFAEVLRYTSGPIGHLGQRRSMELLYSSRRLNGKMNLAQLGIPRWIFSPMSPHRGVTWVRLWVLVWDVMKMREWCDRMSVVLGDDDRVQIVDTLHQRLTVLEAVANDNFDISMLEREAKFLDLDF